MALNDPLTWQWIWKCWHSFTYQCGLPDTDARLFAVQQHTTFNNVSMDWIGDRQWEERDPEHPLFLDMLPSRSGPRVTAQWLHAARRNAEATALVWLKAIVQELDGERGDWDLARRVVQQFGEFAHLIRGLRPVIRWHHRSTIVLPCPHPLDSIAKAISYGELPAELNIYNFLEVCVACRAICHSTQTCVCSIPDGFPDEWLRADPEMWADLGSFPKGWEKSSHYTSHTDERWQSARWRARAKVRGWDAR
ncbi:MAG TPA: hypothetical protein VMY40_14965 [Anaerolineae bacterium]|nr:hypothetical protein [Anaerolineae bacterium]